MSDAAPPTNETVNDDNNAKFAEKERRKEEKRAQKKKEKKERLKAQKKEEKRRKKREEAKLKGEELLEPLLEGEDEDEDDSDGELGLSMGESESELEMDADEQIPMVAATIIDDGSSAQGVNEQKESEATTTIISKEAEGAGDEVSTNAPAGTTDVPSIDLTATTPEPTTASTEADTITSNDGVESGQDAEGVEDPIVEITPRTEARINDTMVAALVEHGIVVEDRQAVEETAVDTTITTSVTEEESVIGNDDKNDEGNLSSPKSPVLSNPVDEVEDNTLISSISSVEVSQLQSELDAIKKEKEDSLKAIEEEKRAIEAEREQLAMAVNLEKEKALSLEKEKEAATQEALKHKEELLKAEEERKRVLEEKQRMQEALEKEAAAAAALARDKHEMETQMAKSAELQSLQNSSNDAMLAELEKEKEEKEKIAAEVLRLKEERELAELRLQQESEMKDRLAKEHEEAQAILDKERRETALIHEQFAQEKELLAERAEREMEDKEKRMLAERDDMETKLGAEMERIRMEQEERERLLEEERQTLDEERARKEKEIEESIMKAQREKEEQEAVLAAEKAAIALSIQEGVEAEKKKLSMDFSASEEASKRKKLESIMAKEAARERSLKLRADARNRRMQEVAKRRAIENTKHGVANDSENALAIEVLGSTLNSTGSGQPGIPSPKSTYKALNTSNPYSDGVASPASHQDPGPGVGVDMNDDLEDSVPGVDYSAAMMNVEGTLMSPQRPTNTDKGKTKPSPSKSSPIPAGTPGKTNKSHQKSPRSASPERVPSADVSIGHGGLSPKQIAQRAVAASLAYSADDGGSELQAPSPVRASGGNSAAPQAISYHTHTTEATKRTKSKYPMTEKRMKAKQLYELQKAQAGGADPGLGMSMDATESGIAYRTAPTTSTDNKNAIKSKDGKKSPRGNDQQGATRRTHSRSPTREVTTVANLDPQPPSPRGGGQGGYKVHKERSKLPSQIKKEKQRQLALHTQNRYSENDSVNAAIADVIASRSPDSKVPTDLHDPRVARRGGSPGRGSPSPGVPQSPTADGDKGLSTSTSSPGSFHKGPQEGDRQGGGRLPHIANNIKSHQLRRVRNSFAPEELYDNEGHLIVETTSRVRSAHLPGGKSKKPLYKRLEEMKHQRDLEEERQRQEEYAKYRIDRARAQPTREEIEQHMRDHEVYHTLRNQQKALTNPTSYPSGLNRGFPPSSDTSNAVGPNTGVEEVRSAAFAAYFNGNKDRKGDKKVLKAGYDDVRGVPPKGVKKAQRDWSYLDNLPDEASSIQKGHTDTGGHSMPTQHSHAVDHYDHEPNPALLRTKYKQAAKEEIVAKKQQKLLAEEEKKHRIEAKKRYSESVRENLLESPAYKPNPGKSTHHHVGFEADKNYQYNVDNSNHNGYSLHSGYSPKKLMMASVDDASRMPYDHQTHYSSPHQRAIGGTGKVKGGGFKGLKTANQLPAPMGGRAQDIDPQSLSLSPRSSKVGQSYISEVIESKDQYEKKMAQVYESGFEQFFRRK